jgi:hypothetical protein
MLTMPSPVYGARVSEMLQIRPLGDAPAPGLSNRKCRPSRSATAAMTSGTPASAHHQPEQPVGK